MSTMHYVELLPLINSRNAGEEAADYICKLNIRGNISIENAHEIAVLAKALMDGGFKRMIFNLENLNYIDSTGIGTIIRIKKNCMQSGCGEIVLYNVPPKINEVFDLVNLKDFVKISYSEQKAIEYLKTISFQA